MLSLLEGARHDSVLLLLPSLEREIAKIQHRILVAEKSEHSDLRRVEQQLERVEGVLDVPFVRAYVFITGVKTQFVDSQVVLYN